MANKGEIVILCTQATALSNGHETGAWAEEIAAPYYAFKNAGYNVTIAGPKGGAIPLDKVSLQDENLTPETKKWLADDEAQEKQKKAVGLSSVDPSKIVALFAAGGHGAAVDFPDSPEIAKFVSDVYESGKVVSSVCHGAEIFKSAKDKNGDPIVKGKKVTGFSDAEEKAVGLDNIEGLHAPETIVKKLGANYSKAGKDWEAHAVVDTSGKGPLVTGQNPGSSEVTALEVIKVLG